MAVEIKVKDLSPNEVLEVVKELRQSGLVQGIHFDFEYHKPVWDNFSGHEAARFTIFTFHEEKYATFFALKYGS